MRPIALSRKNSLFAGSDEGGENWACMASLIETCKLNEVNPLTYMAELLTRLVNGCPRTASTNSCRGAGRPNQTPERERAPTHRLP